MRMRRCKSHRHMTYMHANSYAQHAYAQIGMMTYMHANSYAQHAYAQMHLNVHNMPLPWPYAEMAMAIVYSGGVSGMSVAWNQKGVAMESIPW